MSLTKYTEEQLEGKRKEITKLREEIRGLEDVRNDKDSPVWKRLGPRIHESIAANREQIEKILAAGPVRRDESTGLTSAVDPIGDFCAVKTLGGAIAMAKNILAAVEVEPAIESKRNRVEALTKELERAKSEQGI